MSASTRSNLFDQLSQDITVKDILIDVGCGRLHDLIDFEYSEFKTLKGLDRNLYQPFRDYRRIKNLEHTPELHRHFIKRFLLRKIDFREYDFGSEQFSLIICKHVLHFYSDNEKLAYLELFYNAMQSGGLLFIKMNHNKNVDNTDLQHMEQIERTVYRNKTNLDDVRYLIDADSFLNSVKEKYSLLENHTIVDDKAVSFVIRK